MMALAVAYKTEILVLTLFFIIVAHKQSLGAYAFEKRAALQSYKTLQSVVRGAMPLPVDGSVDILQIMENIDAWKGQRVVAEGMVYRDEKIPDRHIVVYRFLMTCCAADAYYQSRPGFCGLPFKIKRRIKETSGFVHYRRVCP